MDSNSVVSTAMGSEKKGKGLKIVTGIMAIVAICGVGFGIYGLTKSQETENVKVQVKNNDGSLTTIDATEIEAKEGNTVVVNSVSSKPENLERYIYVAQWGIKIFVPTSLSGFSYHFDLKNGYETLKIAGASCEKSCQYVPDFVDMDKNDGTVNRGLAGLARYHKDYSGERLGQKVITIGDYSYYYEHPQFVMSQTETEIQWETESSNLLEKILTDQNNYSEL